MEILEARSPRSHGDSSLREQVRTDSSLLDRTCHELRRPLSVISGYSELLAEGLSGPLNAEQAEHLGILRRNVERLNRTIEDIFTVFSSMIEPAGVEELDLARQVEELVAARRGAFERAGARITARIERPTPHPLLDGRRTSEALGRLLDHALRFAPRESEVLVRVHTVNGRVRIEVRDPGPCLSREEVGHAFDYMFRSDRIQLGNDPGGSDLTVCRALVESLGGRTWAANRRGQGTTYTIELPGADAA